ncbi:MAG: hypothetical protein ABIG60_02640 [Patescibacteria group bacterium]
MINGLEVITWPTRDFTDDNINHLRQCLEYITDFIKEKQINLNSFSVYYIYHLTHTSAVLKKNWHYFIQVLDEIQVCEKSLDSNLITRINFHHQGAFDYDDHPDWQTIDQSNDFQTLNAVKESEKIYDLYIEAKRIAKNDIHQIINECIRRNIEPNFENTPLIKYNSKQNWELLYFLPEEIAPLVDTFPELRVTLDISHLCLGKTAYFYQALPYPFAAIVNHLKDLINIESLKDDFTFRNSFRLLKNKISQIHISGCAGMNEGDEGRPLNDADNLIDWKGVLNNIEVYCPNAILVPEIKNSHFDDPESKQIAVEVIKTYDYLADLCLN